MLYFPDSTNAHSAMAMLRRWIKRIPQLAEGLEKHSMGKNSKYYTPQQARLIEFYLDEP